MKTKFLVLLAFLVGCGDNPAQTAAKPNQAPVVEAKAQPVAVEAPKAVAAPVELKTESVVLSKSNLIVLNEEISPKTMGKVLFKAKQLDAALTASLANRAKETASGQKTPLYIFLNSPGGSIQTGLEMMESLRGLDRPVHTVTLFAASMAWQLVQNLDRRFILRHGVMMSHQASGGFSGTFGGGGGHIDARFGLWMDRLNEMDEQTVKRTNGKQTLASYQRAYSQELWRTGSKSVVDGYSDAVAVVKCDASLSGVDSESLTLDLGIAQIQISYDLDQCPTNTNPMNIQISMETNQGKMTIPVFQAKGGEFGPVCLQAATTEAGKNKLCAADATLDLFKINDAVERFKNQGKFDSSKQRPLPMYW